MNETRTDETLQRQTTTAGAEDEQLGRKRAGPDILMEAEHEKLGIRRAGPDILRQKMKN